MKNKMSNGQKWSVANTIVVAAMSVLTLFGLVTQSKAAKYDESRLFDDLEDRYDLKKKDEED